MKKCLKKFIFIPVVSAIEIYFVLQTAFLSYYYFSCVRLKQVEITRWNTTPYKTIIPVKYCRYDRRDFRDHTPLFTASGRRYNLMCAPEKSLLRLTEHRHLLYGFICWKSMYQITDPEIEKQLLEMWNNKMQNSGEDNIEISGN
ncbi:MAG: hypothetical protein E7044_02885 [Lentisphaerae bacterium]|nr:hypothetical protein [Lentisphaerota bacterium]